MVFILKPDKDRYNLAKSFRPINLSSFLLKTFERMIDYFIRETCKQTLFIGIISYQAGKSCELANELSLKIEKILRDKEVELRVFMDIEGAFDNTSFKSIKTVAEDHAVDSTMCSWIDGMLCSRLVVFSIGNSIISRRVALRATSSRHCGVW